MLRQYTKFIQLWLLPNFHVLESEEFQLPHTALQKNSLVHKKGFYSNTLEETTNFDLYE